MSDERKLIIDLGSDELNEAFKQKLADKLQEEHDEELHRDLGSAVLGPRDTGYDD